MVKIEDGKGRGFSAEVTDEQHLSVDATTDKRVSHESREHGRAFVWTSTFATGTTDVEVLYIKNTSTIRKLFIDSMRYSASAACIFSVFKHTGTATGTTITAEKDEVFCVTELRIAIADVLAGTVTDGTMEGLAYDKLLALASLANGILFSRVAKGKIVFSVPIKQLGDFLATGSDMVNHISDGTNTFITLLVKFPEPIVLDGSRGDFLSFTINDDLSGLLLFTAAARGVIKKVDKESIFSEP